jgi:hypothetical protein
MSRTILELPDLDFRLQVTLEHFFPRCASYLFEFTMSIASLKIHILISSHTTTCHNVCCRILETGTKFSSRDHFGSVVSKDIVVRTKYQPLLRKNLVLLV